MQLVVMQFMEWLLKNSKLLNKTLIYSFLLGPRGKPKFVFLFFLRYRISFFLSSSANQSKLKTVSILVIQKYRKATIKKNQYFQSCAKSPTNRQMYSVIFFPLSSWPPSSVNNLLLEKQSPGRHSRHARHARHARQLSLTAEENLKELINRDFPRSCVL